MTEDAKKALKGALDYPYDKDFEYDHDDPPPWARHAALGVIDYLHMGRGGFGEVLPAVLGSIPNDVRGEIVDALEAIIKEALTQSRWGLDGERRSAGDFSAMTPAEARRAYDRAKADLAAVKAVAHCTCAPGEGCSDCPPDEDEEKEDVADSDTWLRVADMVVSYIDDTPEAYRITDPDSRRRELARLLWEGYWSRA